MATFYNFDTKQKTASLKTAQEWRQKGTIAVLVDGKFKYLWTKTGKLIRK